MSRSIPILLLILALAACHGDLFGPEPAEGGPPQEDRLAVFVHFGGSPGWQPDVAYSWTGGPASSVTVTRLSHPAGVVWQIVTASPHGIRPVLTHGRVPFSSTATINLEPVLPSGAGLEYEVRVTLVGAGSPMTARFTY